MTQSIEQTFILRELHSPYLVEAKIRSISAAQACQQLHQRRFGENAIFQFLDSEAILEKLYRGIKVKAKYGVWIGGEGIERRYAGACILHRILRKADPKRLCKANWVNCRRVATKGGICKFCKN